MWDKRHSVFIRDERGGLENIIAAEKVRCKDEGKESIADSLIPWCDKE